MLNWDQMTQGSAPWARRADAGIARTMSRRRNEAHGAETKSGGPNSAFKLHKSDRQQIGDAAGETLVNLPHLLLRQRAIECLVPHTECCLDHIRVVGGEPVPQPDLVEMRDVERSD